MLSKILRDLAFRLSRPQFVYRHTSWQWRVDECILKCLQPSHHLRFRQVLDPLIEARWFIKNISFTVIPLCLTNLSSFLPYLRYNIVANSLHIQ